MNHEYSLMVTARMNCVLDHILCAMLSHILMTVMCMHATVPCSAHSGIRVLQLINQNNPELTCSGLLVSCYWCRNADTFVFQKCYKLYMTLYVALYPGPCLEHQPVKCWSQNFYSCSNVLLGLMMITGPSCNPTAIVSGLGIRESSTQKRIKLFFLWSVQPASYTIAICQSCNSSLLVR